MMAMGDMPGPIAGSKLTEDYLRSIGRMAYLWGWPLVNMHNRLSLASQVPGPGLVGGVIPIASPGSAGMLHDYVAPEERAVACPNQDVVYGLGIIDGRRGPSVVQVPDFGGRFWVYQGVNQRTDSFVRLGAMYETKPGLYMVAPTSWQGEVPAGIEDVFRFDTRIAVVIPRVFMDDTDEDRAAIQPLINQIMVYPLAQYSGAPQTFDWSKAPVFPRGSTSQGEQETQWVDPEHFFSSLGEVLGEVPARPGEESLYAWFASLIEAARDPVVAEVLNGAAADANQTLLAEVFQFRHIGVPVAHHWTTQRNGAAFGTDYLSRTAMARANIFVNTPSETTYFYQDLDEAGRRLNGNHRYSVTFPANGLPPVRGFWSLTLYNQHHFFHANEVGRFSLGTKNKTLRFSEDGSLTLYASATPPEDPELAGNWLPPPQKTSPSTYGPTGQSRQSSMGVGRPRRSGSDVNCPTASGRSEGASIANGGHQTEPKMTAQPGYPEGSDSAITSSSPR
jgi:hypothetical protein